jgi:hypothetical protein
MYMSISIKYQNLSGSAILFTTLCSIVRLIFHCGRALLVATQAKV